MNFPVVLLFQPLHAEARRLRANGTAAGKHADVHGQRQRLCRLQIRAHRIRLHPRLQRSGHGREIVKNPLLICPAARRSRQTAIAVYDRRQALTQLGVSKPGTENCRIRVPVNVDKARCDEPPRHIENASCPRVR